MSFQHFREKKETNLLGRYKFTCEILKKILDQLLQSSEMTVRNMIWCFVETSSISLQMNQGDDCTTSCYCTTYTGQTIKRHKRVIF